MGKVHPVGVENSLGKIQNFSGKSPSHDKDPFRNSIQQQGKPNKKQRGKGPLLLIGNPHSYWALIRYLCDQILLPASGWEEDRQPLPT
jgi:hypothetical protein